MSITFSSGANSITVKQPYFGYSTTVTMNLHYSRVTDGYKIGDDGAEYDSRMCEIPVWMLDADDQLAVSAFFGDVYLGRGNNFTMTLPTGSGFFPFGADKGDEGDFVCSLVDHQKGGAILQPFREHTNSFKIILVTAPAYTPISPEGEGYLSIGTITALRPFQELPAPTNYQGIARNVSRGGVVSSVDLGIAADVFETDISLEMREGNCAAIIAYLQTIRGGEFTIVTGANDFLFGVQFGSSGTYVVKNLSPQIKVTHDNYDRFNMSVRLLYIPQVIPQLDEAFELEDTVELEDTLQLT